MIGWIHFSVPFCISSDSVENAESSPSTLEDRASYEFNLGEALHTSLSDPKELSIAMLLLGSLGRLRSTASMTSSP